MIAIKSNDTTLKMLITMDEGKNETYTATTIITTGEALLTSDVVVVGGSGVGVEMMAAEGMGRTIATLSF